MKSLVVFVCVELFICFVALVLHISVIPSNQWSHFYSATELGIPAERGHYGFWRLCIMKQPFQSINCDPLDTLFRPPPLNLGAGITAIVAAVTIGLFFPFGILRLNQIAKQKTNLSLKTKAIGIIKVTLALLSFILIGLVIVLTTIHEETSDNPVLNYLTHYQGFRIYKGWAFWIEIVVCVLMLVLVILCVIENLQVSRLTPLIHLPPTYDSGANSPSTFFQDPSMRSDLYVAHRAVCLCCPIHNDFNTLERHTFPRNGDELHVKCCSPHCQLSDGYRRGRSPTVVKFTDSDRNANFETPIINNNNTNTLPKNGDKNFNTRHKY